VRSSIKVSRSTAAEEADVSVAPVSKWYEIWY
jgi:hypothetical protein